jgi:hypothetical protein
MIRFDHERLHFAQSLDYHLGRVTEIGDEAEAARSGVKGKPQGVDRVMRHRERLHRDVTNRKLRTGPKNPPVDPESFRDSLEKSTAPNCLGRERIAINRQIKFTAENLESANVIAMFVSEKHPIQLIGRNAALAQTQDQLPRAQSAIDKKLATIGCDQCAVSRAAAAEHGQAEHGS